MPRARADKSIRIDELRPSVLLKFLDGDYRRVVPQETVLAERDGVTLMVPRLPALTPRQSWSCAGSQVQQRHARHDSLEELLVALNDDPPSGKR